LSKGLLPASASIGPFAVGYGAGTKEFREQPNLLRVVIGSVEATEPFLSFPESDTVSMITTAIDDMPPNVLAYVTELLIERSALEAYLRPVVMKKGRAGFELLVLCEIDRTEETLSIIARETTTIGVRVERISRRKANRGLTVLESEEFGVIRSKHVENGLLHERTEPEFEEVKRIAREKNLPLQEVYARLRQSGLTEGSPMKKG